MKILKITENEVITDCGITKFYAVNKLKTTHCNHCFLREADPPERCKNVPCGKGEPKRSDCFLGVFSIREMPKNKYIEINN